MKTSLRPASLFAAASLLAALACDKAAPAGEPAGAAKGEPEPALAAAPEPGAPGEAGKHEIQEAQGEGDAQAKGGSRMAEAKAKAEASKSKRGELNRLLNEGRAAVKDERFDEGIALYRQALKIDPQHPKVLGELGFAALRKGELELAESMTRRAIDLTEGTKGLGALYYNLGRIEEQRGKIAEARAAYERSLHVRPGNEVVEGKLAGLGDASGGPGPDSAAALCAELHREWECYASEAEVDALPEEEREYAGLCQCAIDKQISEGSGESFIVAAALLKIEGMLGIGGGIDERYLAIQTRGQGWQLRGMVVTNYTPGVMGISNEGKVESFAFEELAASPGQELRLVTHNAEIDTDMGVNLIHQHDVGQTLICLASSKSAGECGELVSSFSSGTEQLFDEEPIEPVDAADIGTSSWKVEIAFSDGQVSQTISAGKQDMPPEQQAREGTRSVEEALRAVGTTPLH